MNLGGWPCLLADTLHLLALHCHACPRLDRKETVKKVPAALKDFLESAD
jgi:hypothetical protein